MKYSWVLHAKAQEDQTEELIKNWMDIALSYDETLGLSPAIIGIEGKGYSGKITDFKKGYKKVTDTAFKGVEGIGLYTIESDDRDFAFYWKVLMDIVFSEVKGITAFIGVDLDVAGKDQVLNEAVLPVSKLLNVTYGYSFVMPAEKGPYSYGNSFIHVEEGHELTDEEEMLIIQGSPYIRLINDGKGILRDVFQENLLADVQLNAQVEGKSLKEWILSDPAHGSLSDFAGKPYWKVDKNNLVNVREVLHRNGLILAYDKDIIPGIPD